MAKPRARPLASLLWPPRGAQDDMPTRDRVRGLLVSSSCYSRISHADQRPRLPRPEGFTPQKPALRKALASCWRQAAVGMAVKFGAVDWSPRPIARLAHLLPEHRSLRHGAARAAWYFVETAHRLVAIQLSFALLVRLLSSSQTAGEHAKDLIVAKLSSPVESTSRAPPRTFRLPCPRDAP